MKKYEAPETKIILLQVSDVLATSENPNIGKGENTGAGTGTEFGRIPLW